MLEPRDRQLLFETLQPPDGFRFDQGIGTTYTLDLLALLMAPLAFTFFEQQGEDGRPAVDSLEILESLRRHADGLTLFCHAGGIDLPKAFYPQLAFIETSIVECQAPGGGAFHPKAWILRWVGERGAIRYRVLCLSRNLTFSRAWDTLLALDGVTDPTRRAAIAKNRGLVEFVRALPGFATRKPTSGAAHQRAELFASELERTEFALPDGFADLKFWPLGLGGRARDPLADAGNRLLIVSPFLTLGRLESLAADRSEVTLVSTASALACLTRRPSGIGRFYCLAEKATIEADAESDIPPETDVQAIQQSDLHAKLYVSENGREAHIWTGSANATSAAFGGNVELLVELVGPKRIFGIDALMEPQKGEVRFNSLLQDASSFVATEKADSAVEALERRLSELQQSLAAAQFEARVSPASADAFAVALVHAGTAALAIDPGLTLRCWPVTVTSSVGANISAIPAGSTIARFNSLSFGAITSFLAFELAGRAGGEDRQVRFVLNVPLVGAPEGRREQILRSLVKDRARLMRFLWLLLADEGMTMPDMTGGARGDVTTGNGAPWQTSSGLFEMLLRNLDRAPERLDHLHTLLKELRRDAAEEDLFPPNFDDVWDPIWRERERLRLGPQT